MQQNTTDSRPSAGRVGADPAPATPATPAPDLTVNKVLAGAGAAATSAVLGSSFGAAGTVVGAAIGSVASTVAASIYQRYLDRTRDTLVARIRPVRRDRDSSDATVRLPVEAPEDATVLLPVIPTPGRRRPRRRWVIGIVGTVLVFLLGLLVVTGLEWIKGSTVSTGQPGTSVGRVLNQQPAPIDGADAPEPAPGATTPEPSAERAPAPSGAAEPSTEPPAEGTTPDGFSGGTPDEGGSDPGQVDPTTAPAQSPPIGP